MTWVNRTRRCDRMGAEMTHNHPTSCRGFSLKPLCCVFRVLWWKTGGHVCSLLFKEKLIFLDLVDQVEEHNLFHLCQDEPRCETLSVSICVVADMCVHSGVPRSTVWSLVLLRWCCVSGPVPLGRGHPPAGTHRAGCWTPLISLHCWLLHTPLLSASRASKHHLSSVTPPKQHPPPTTLSAAPPYWFPPKSDFPRPVSCSSSFLTNYAVKLMAPHLNYNLYETLSTTLRKRQTTHTIASQSSSLDDISSLPLVPNTSSTDSGVVLNPRCLWIFLNGSFGPEGVSWTLQDVWSTLQTGFIAWIHSVCQ